MKYKVIILLLIVIVLSYILPLIAKDWRTVIIAGIISGLFLTNRFKSFIIGFMGALVAWLLNTLYILSSQQNQALLSIFSKIADVPLILLLIIFILIPSLLTGLSSLIVTLIRILIKKTHS
jgi:hypothetical protein